jgi:hypothetical protein
MMNSKKIRLAPKARESLDGLPFDQYTKAQNLSARQDYCRTAIFRGSIRASEKIILCAMLFI